MSLPKNIASIGLLAGFIQIAAIGILLAPDVSIDNGGGIGHGKKKLRWIERDQKILIFKTQEEVELFIDIEKRNVNDPISEPNPVNVIKPVEVIDKVEIKQLSKSYGYQKKLYHADQAGNIERVIAIYRELQQREDEDIEFLLIHT